MSLRYVKDGVEFSPCTPDLIDGIIAATRVLYKYGTNLVVTSGTDGVHPTGGTHDPHYSGYAFDLRSSAIKVTDVPTVVRDLRLAMPGWVIVQETDHIHCQCQKFKDPLAV